MIIDTREKVGFVLPGGGVKAVEAQLGMIEALTECGIKPDFIYACSGGALTGLVYLTQEDPFLFIEKTDINNYLKMNNPVKILMGKEVYSTEHIEKLFEKMLGDSILNNLIVNMTDVETHETYYAKGTVSSILSSMSIPKVFPVRKLNGTVYRNTTPYKTDGPIVHVSEEVLLKDREVYDGGIYDLYPMPDAESIRKCKYLYVLCCPADNSPETMEASSHLKQSFNWLMETMERGFRVTVSAYDAYPNVAIFRPEEYASPMLGWSENFGLYRHCYDYMKKILKGE